MYQSPVFSGEIKGFVKKNNSIYQFDDFTKININNKVSVKYKADREIIIKVSYSGPNNNNKILGNLSLDVNQIFSFPEDGKYVLLKEEGMHTIIVEPSIGNPLAINFFVSQDKINKNIFGNPKKSKEKKEDFLQAKTTKVNPISYVKNNNDYKIIKNIKNSSVQRASGSEIYKEISGSTVLILGQDGIGSGVVIESKKKSDSKKLITQILTNYHVIKDQKKIGVVKKPSIMSNEVIENSEIYPAKVLRVNKGYDLALIEIEHKKIGSFFSKDLKPIKLGSKDDLEVAQKTHAIGHPSGKYWTYTQGVISQIRDNYKWSYDENWNLKADIIQTQTPINPGNSGGPLINKDYELIGLNSFVSKGEGLNYAVSISTIKDFLQGNSQTLASLLETKSKENKKINTVKTNNKKEKKCVFISKLDVYKGLGASFTKGQDGYHETEAWDCYAGPEADTWQVDKNQNKKTDQTWVDYDGNGNFDYLIDYVFYQGNLHTVISYFNNDGSLKIVKRGFDFDNDGTIDKWDVS